MNHHEGQVLLSKLTCSEICIYFISWWMLKKHMRALLLYFKRKKRNSAFWLQCVHVKICQQFVEATTLKMSNELRLCHGHLKEDFHQNLCSDVISPAWTQRKWSWFEIFIYQANIFPSKFCFVIREEKCFNKHYILGCASRGILFPFAQSLLLVETNKVDRQK